MLAHVKIDFANPHTVRLARQESSHKHKHVFLRRHQTSQSQQSYIHLFSFRLYCYSLMLTAFYFGSKFLKELMWFSLFVLIILWNVFDSCHWKTSKWWRLTKWWNSLKHTSRVEKSHWSQNIHKQIWGFPETWWFLKCD